MKNIAKAIEKNTYECMDWMENIIKDLLEKYLKSSIEYGYGIRILNQDLCQ